MRDERRASLARVSLGERDGLVPARRDWSHREARGLGHCKEDAAAHRKA
jgi:hypothetical protein